MLAVTDGEEGGGDGHIWRLGDWRGEGGGEGRK